MENEKKETSIVLANEVTAVNTDLFGESKTKRVTTLDLTNDLEQDMFLNSMQDADFRLNDCVGKIINVVGVILTETPNETINEETGETIVRKKHSMCLFDENGKSYVTGSGACYNSFITISAMKGMPTKENPIKFEIIKTPAKEKGHEYLKLKLAK